MTGAVCIVQARLGSTRFPAKVLRRIGDWTVLEHVVRRCVKAVPLVAVAAPERDAPEFRRLSKLPVFGSPGDEADVLARFVRVASLFPHARVIVRVTADCPFVDPATIRLLVELQRRTGAEYVSNLPATPQVDGLDVEVFTADLLLRADREATAPYDREHVTPWIRRTARTVAVLARHLDLPGPMQHRWTVDTPEDLEWCRMVHAMLGSPAPPRPTLAELCALIRERPDLARTSDVARAA